MPENDLDQTIKVDGAENSEPEILVNEYGQTKNTTVVIEEPGRTVMLTDSETIVIEKQPVIGVAPKNRPRKVYGGMWGPAEIATAGLASLAVLTTILLYIFVVVPSNRELERNRAERNRLETELISARAKYGDIASTETQVAKLLTSVNDFESRFLPVAATGQTALYQRINGLIASYGLVNTTGPDYAPLEIADQTNGNQSDEERGRAKFRSLFPGVYVTTTVEGTYQNLRRFIQEIETGNEFVVISAVELEPSDSEKPANTAEMPTQASAVPGQFTDDPRVFQRQMNQGPTGIAAQPQQPERPRGKTHGETVRLRLEMAAYFRRPNVITTETDTVEQ